MRAWQIVLFALGSLWLYEFATTKPAKAQQLGRRIQKWMPLKPTGSIVTETNSAIASGQTFVAGEPCCSTVFTCGYQPISLRTP